MTAKYVLHAKVLNAKDLVCEDHSPEETHPFVRLHLQDQTSYYKTETVQGTTNPEWNETLDVRVYNPEKDQLIVEVMNQDINKDVLICDPCLLELNTMNIGGDKFEANLDLFKDDQPVGHLDIEFQLTPKEPTEDAKFTGPVLLRINITEAQGVTEQEEDGGSEDTYLTFLLQGHDESEKVKSIVNKTSLDPAWNQSFSLICDDPNNDVLLMQMVSGDTVIIPQEKQPIGEIEPGTRGTIDLAFEKGDVTGGHLGIEYQTFDLDTISKSPVNIHLKVLSGSNLKKMDADKSDPYVKISVGGTEVSTDVQKNTLDPEWNQEFDFVSNDPIHDKLRLQLIDKDVAVDDKMMDDIVLPVRDLKAPEDKNPILYDVPIQLKGKPAGHLQFEILAEGECLQVASAKSACIIEFIILEAKFDKCAEPVLTYGTHSREEDPPDDVELNEKVSLKCDNPEDEYVVFCFDDDEGESLCDPITVRVKDIGINGITVVKQDTYLDEEVTGHAEIQFLVKEEGKEIPPAQPEQTVQERSAPIVQDEDEYCDFKWGTYGSSYSTSFTGYSNCTPLSSTLDEAEIHYHHKHPVFDNDTTKPKKRSETLTGKVNSIELDAEQKDLFVAGDKYYATAILYGKSSRSSSKSTVQSNAVEAQGNSLNFNNFSFNFDKKFKKGDYIDVNVFHQSDNKQIAKSTIYLEKVPESQEEAPNTFPLVENKLIKTPAKVGTLKANLKHTVQFQ